MSLISRSCGNIAQVPKYSIAITTASVAADDLTDNTQSAGGVMTSL